MTTLDVRRLTFFAFRNLPTSAVSLTVITKQVDVYIFCYFIISRLNFIYLLNGFSYTG